MYRESSVTPFWIPRSNNSALFKSQNGISLANVGQVAISWTWPTSGILNSAETSSGVSTSFFSSATESSFPFFFRPSVPKLFFCSSILAASSAWTFSPAALEGRPTTVTPGFSDRKVRHSCAQRSAGHASSDSRVPGASSRARTERPSLPVAAKSSAYKKAPMISPLKRSLVM